MSQHLPAEANASRETSRANPRRALRLLRFTFVFFVASIAIGLAWDQVWHITHVFDTFFSPPHLFTYSMTAVTTGLVGLMVFAPSLRQAFDQGFDVPILSVPIPGSLVLLAGGLVMLPFAGSLDAIWHSLFGLDETNWSTPHAMISWALFVAMLGFVACRLALRPYRPMGGLAAVSLGIILLLFSTTPFLGPIYGNATLATVRAIAKIPVLAAQPAVQHAVRVTEAWNLTRTNPLLAPLGALWAGTMLALLQGLDHRARVWMTTALLWSYLTLIGNLDTAQRLDQAMGLSLARAGANWLPLPILPAAVVFLLLEWLRLPKRWAWIASGLAFGICAAAIWGPYRLGALPALIAAITMWFGARLGSWLYHTVDHPRPKDILTVLGLGIGVPIATGVIDLSLRRMIPSS